MRKKEIIEEVVGLCIILILIVICVMVGVVAINNRAESKTEIGMSVPKSNPIQEYTVNKFYRECVYKAITAPVEPSQSLVE